MKNLLRAILMISCCSLLTACTLFDNTAPEVSLSNNDTIQIEVNTDFDFDKYIIATDNRIDSSEISLETTFDSSILGEQEISVSATDTKENTSTIDFTVNVVDTTAPEIQLNGDEEITIAHGSLFEDEGITANDNYDNECSIQTLGTVDTSTIGTYKLTYICIDSSLNESTIERTVNVKDLTGPEINLGENEVFEIKLGEVLPDDFGLAYDEIDGYVDTVVTGVIDYLRTGEYSLTFSATDSSGNTTTINRIICINPIIIESSMGITTTFNFFEITDTGVFYMDDTVLSIDVYYENTTDKTVDFSPSFLFKSNGKDVCMQNADFSTAYSIFSLDAKEQTPEVIDFAYGGDSSFFYNADEIQFEINNTYGKRSLENKLNFCIQELVDQSFTDGYIIYAEDFIPLESENTNN